MRKLNDPAHYQRQSGDPLTWADIHEGLLNTFLAPLRWLREQLARLVERAWVR
jgi:hypothetical protein